MPQHDAQRTNRTPYVGPQRAALRFDYAIPAAAFFDAPVVTLSGRGYMSMTWCAESNPFIGCLRYESGLGTWTPLSPYRLVSVDGGTPIIGPDGTRYQPIAGGLVAWTPIGGFKWSYGGLGGSATFGPGDTIYWTSGRTVTVLAQADGTLVRRFALPDEPFTDITVGHDGSVYYGSVTPQLTAVGPDGTLLWSFPTLDQMHSPPVVGSDGTVYAGGRELYAIGADGSLRWSYGVAGMSFSGTNVALGWNSRVHVRATNRIVSLDGATGVPIWQLPVSGARNSLMVGGDGTVYFIDDVGVGAIGSEGLPKWRLPRAGLSYASTMALAADGTLYIASAPNFLALTR